MRGEKLSSLVTELEGFGIALVRDRGSYLAALDIENHRTTLFTVCVDDLFDADGNRFEDDIP
jgi:hypothetical protein